MKLLSRNTLIDPQSGLRLHCLSFKTREGIFAICLELGLLSPASKSEKKALQDLKENVAFYLLLTAKERAKGRIAIHSPASKKYWDLYLKNGGVDHLMADSDNVVPHKLSSRKLPQLALV